ncbi:MAG: nucleotide exchange factor GrpE [Betaproteobacteria bacterium]|nr:nucleotide exchange factor GrpE [Betaproteobacteria bacterium]
MSETTQNPAAEPLPAAAPAADATQAPAAGAPAENRQEAMETLLANANAKAAENYDNYLRAKAEMENIRRRSAEDVLKANKFGIEKMAEALLAVKDSMDAALKVENTSVESFKTGVELTARQLTQVFEKFSIVEVSPAGEKFDPTRHQAIAAIESDQPANTVIDVMQKGYLLHERVLRPALVAVAKAKAPATEPETPPAA